MRPIIQNERNLFFRTFKIFDDDGSRSLDRNEFFKGIRDYGIVMERDVADAAFVSLDKDSSGKLDFDEFLIALRVSCPFLIMFLYRKENYTPSQGILSPVFYKYFLKF